MNGVILCYLLVLATTTTLVEASRHGSPPPAIVDDDTVICQIRVLDVQFEDHRPSRREYRCVSEEDGSESDMAYEIDLDETSVGEYEHELAAGTLYASVPHGRISRNQKGTITDRVITPEGAKVELSRGKPEKKQSVRRRRHSDNASHTSRHLMATSGEVSVLVIRVSGNDVTPTFTAAELSDKIFGTDDDKVNLKSVYDACSAGKLDFVPAIGEDIVDGVVEIKLDRDITDTTSTSVDNDVVEMATAKYGVLSKAFDHVMLCHPPGTTGGGWVAYAYLNWYRSSYNDKWCGYPSAQVHEIGHNLGLEHSNEGQTVYGDQSGLMGYSYGNDEGPNMCFNGAKSWKLGWYNDRHIDVDPKSNGSWAGKLATFVDYQSASASDFIIINVDSLYLLYNRKRDFNDGTKEKQNQVTVTNATDLGGPSLSLAGLGSSDSYTYEKYDGVNDLVIKVCGIYNDEIPNYAHVSIYIEGSQQDTCSQPLTPSPTVSPSRIPSSEPTAVPSSAPSNEPSSSPSGSPTSSSQSPSSRPTSNPSYLPSVQPSSPPSDSPTLGPSSVPTVLSSVGPSTAPSGMPSEPPSVSPQIQNPTDLGNVSNSPSSFPFHLPSEVPSGAPTPTNSGHPSSKPSTGPTTVSSRAPSGVPSKVSSPSGEPSRTNSVYPSSKPSSGSTTVPPRAPSGVPSKFSSPSGEPSRTNSVYPSSKPSIGPTTVPSRAPTGVPSKVPSIHPSLPPSTVPTIKPSAMFMPPSIIPSIRPSPKPSGARSSSPSVDLGRTLVCESNEMRFSLSITTDNYPAETEWELTNVAKTWTLSGGPYDQANSEYTKNACIPDDIYLFTMKDKYGDGLCCDNGQGSYSVSIDGVKVVASGGDFRQIESSTLTKECETGEDRIMVQVNTDYFGSETTWTLETVGEGNDETVMTGGEYLPWDTRKDIKCLDATSCYKFTIRDEWGDGMCCSYGSGGYSIDFLGDTKDGSFIEGYEESIYVGTSCPASGASSAASATSVTHTGGRRHRHKEGTHGAKVRETSFAQAQQVDASKHHVDNTPLSLNEPAIESSYLAAGVAGRHTGGSS